MMTPSQTYPLTPITRYTPDDRLLWFEQNAPAIYNKYTPYTNSGIGPSRPLIYNKLTDTSDERFRIAFDTQELPLVSTVVDVRRMGRWLRTDAGINFLINQNYIQGSNAFNETRVYNPLSVPTAASKTGALNKFGPTRHMETSGVLSYAVSSLMSTLGLQTTLQGTNNPIIGTATGQQGGLPYSKYAALKGGARAGLLRFGTANNASVKFDYLWANGSIGGGGFLANLAKALLKGITANIPSTNPMGAFGGQPTNKWKYRPEYKTGGDNAGVFDQFRSDPGKFLMSKTSTIYAFYNKESYGGKVQTEYTAEQLHKYYPDRGEKDFKSHWYAAPNKVLLENMDSTSTNGIGGGYNQSTNIKSVYQKYLNTIESFTANKTANPQYNRSMEAYSGIKDTAGKTYPSYPKNGYMKFSDRIGYDKTIESKNWFAKAGAPDKYNALDVLDGTREILNEYLKSEENQSRDLIFFHFFDLVNNKYVPFRATITSFSDQNSAEWEDISYIGRADKLFVYKGFSRDVNLSFTVYANSAKELIPMWNRINYLVGFTRPSKYTSLGLIGSAERQENIRRAIDSIDQQRQAATQDLAESSIGAEELDEFNDRAVALDSISNSLREELGRSSSERASSFIYPPMVSFTLGDILVDQPCVISSVGVTIPDDTNWETLRADGTYTWYNGNTQSVEKTRQLPLKADVAVTLKVLEKRQSLGMDAHYGKINANSTQKWVL